MKFTIGLVISTIFASTALAGNGSGTFRKISFGTFEENESVRTVFVSDKNVFFEHAYMDRSGKIVVYEETVSRNQSHIDNGLMFALKKSYQMKNWQSVD